MDLYNGIQTQLDLGKEIMVYYIERYKKERQLLGKRATIEHYKGRIKTTESMRGKLELQGVSPTQENALTQVTDCIGVRVVVTFINDIYEILDYFSNHTDLDVVEVKDYVKAPKPNGYRSVHLIVKIPVEVEGVTDSLYGEIQLRTIAMDCWASLDHQLRYKKETIPQGDLIARELKRCATEIAATDLTLQALQEKIMGEEDRYEAVTSGGRERISYSPYHLTNS